MRRLAAVLAAVTLLTTASCTRTHASIPGATKITYITGFGTLGREGYAWMARDRGYFSAAHLDVAIVPGAAGADNTKALASGQAQFAIVDFATAVGTLARDPASDLRIVAAVNQQTVSSIIVLESSLITSTRQLAGKRIGVATGSALKPMFTAYAGNAGLDPNSVTWVPMLPAALPAALAARQVDGIAQYSMAKPTVDRAAKCGACTVVLPYSTYLQDPYGAVLVTTGKYLATHTAPARSFIAALMRGLQDSMREPAALGALMHRVAPTLDQGDATQEMSIMAPFCRATPLGKLEAPRVARGIAVLRASAVVDTSPNPDTLVAWPFVPGGAQ